MNHAIANVWSSEGFMPHGMCFLWLKELLILHALSDGLVAIAYYSIPLALLYFVRHRADLEFRGVFVLFAAFIMACGTTHALEVWTLWVPDYWLLGWVKAATAAVSVVTAVLVWVLMPQMLLLPSPAQLRAANTELQHEIHEHHRLLTALRESEERFRSAFDYAAIGMAVVSLDGRWLKVNQALCSSVGYSEEELLATDFQTITHPDDLDLDLEHVQELLHGSARHYHMEKRYFHKSGAVVWVLLSVALVRDENGAPLYFVAQIQDITERKRAETQLRQIQQELEARVEERTRALEASNRQLERLARCDELTGLYNRRHLMELLDKAFLTAKRYNAPLAVMMLDIDHFKRINDTYGHAAGDRVLTVVGRLLRENLRSADITGRYGGEEFCIALVHTALADAAATAEKLRKRIAATAIPMEDGPVLQITCSIGISQWQPYTTDLQELLEQADKALYQAKQGGRNRVMPPWPANPAARPALGDGSANA